MTLIILDSLLFNYIDYKDYSTPNRSLYFRLINCIELPVSEREKILSFGGQKITFI